MVLPELLLKYPLGRAILSHAVFKMHKKTKARLLTQSNVEDILKNNHLPSVSEQIENLIIYLGDHHLIPGEDISFKHDEFIAPSGAVSGANESFLLQSMDGEGILKCDYHAQGGTIVITYKGWEFYDNLKRGAINSRKAFMAMPFGDERLDNIFNNVFKKAVEETGYVLFRLDEVEKAGLIDDNMRVAIATSRFLIAELTNNNNGAYWEAGYAEGLGKPVIYTCERSSFEKNKTHFDTNHHLAVLWDENGLDDASKKLKSTIRATLLAEAKREDD